MDPNLFQQLAESLKPDVDGTPEFESRVNNTKTTICRIAERYLANGMEGQVASLDSIGSFAYGTNIKGSDRDFVLKFNGPTKIQITEGPWENFGKELAEELYGPVNITPKSIRVAVGTEILEIVSEDGPMEFNRVPFGNVVEGKRGNFSRKAIHELLKAFFQGYPGARNAVRVAKALLIPSLKGLGKQAWSSLITHILYREVRVAVKSGSNDTRADFGGVDAFKLLCRDLRQHSSYTRDSSADMALRWAKNDAKGVEEDVDEALRRFSETLHKLNGRICIDRRQKRPGKMPPFYAFWTSHGAICLTLGSQTQVFLDELGLSWVKLIRARNPNEPNSPVHCRNCV